MWVVYIMMMLLCTIVKTQKQSKCPSTEEWIKEDMGCIHRESERARAREREREREREKGILLSC